MTFVFVRAALVAVLWAVAPGSVGGHKARPYAGDAFNFDDAHD
jgi:hypothetical protein